MKDKLIAIFAFSLLLLSFTNAQWINHGAFPDNTYNGGTHGIAVDPDGKIWVASYYPDIPWAHIADDTIWTSGILVFNEDGSEAKFSPIVTVTTAKGVDTLHGHCRGLETDQNGNIIYVQSSPPKAIKINYTNGSGLASSLLPELGSSPTAAAVSDNGTVYIGPVLGGGGTAIAMYDNDLNYIGNAIYSPPAISRTMEVSADGNTIYWMPFTALKVYVYQRSDEFSSFEFVGSLLEDMSIESSAWNPVTGHLWVSNDERNAIGTYEHLTWYELDVSGTESIIIDSFKWDNTVDFTEFPRGLDFSPDGRTAYFGTFTIETSRIQKAVYQTNDVTELENQILKNFSLIQNFPNPFNPTTKIKYTIPEKANHSLIVFDVLGNELRELVGGEVEAGEYEADFDATNLPSGVYFYRLQTEEFIETKKMILLK
jgi:DNA-binding beta-propeller fold protein YncE